MHSHDLARHRLVRVVRMAFAVLILSAIPALACPVCITAPERTVADWILDSETVVLAREDPSKPFAFVPVQVLKGSVGAAPIPFLVDSTTQQRLRAVPEDAVLLVRASVGATQPFALAKPQAEWQRLAYVDAPYRTLIGQILSLRNDWRADQTGRTRFAFFEALLDHEDPAIRDLALSEIARAPYRLVRTMTLRLASAEIIRSLRDPTMIQWAPTYILLLGQSNDPVGRELIRGTVRTGAIYGAQSNLAAWATALIEIDGPEGISMIAQDYLRASRRSPAELTAIITAFGVHGSDGDPALRPVIVAEYHRLAHTNPEVAPIIAHYLASLNDCSQTTYLEGLLDKADLWSPPESFMLSVYVAMSREKRECRVERSFSPHD